MVVQIKKPPNDVTKAASPISILIMSLICLALFSLLHNDEDIVGVKTDDVINLHSEWSPEDFYNSNNNEDVDVDHLASYYFSIE